MFDILSIVQSAGYLGIFGIILAESGLIFGSFFPGDSLLFMAGVLAGKGFLSLPVVGAIIFIAAVLGNSVGYASGRFFGPKIFKREDSFFFHKDYLERTKNFYKHHGTKTIILARFIPIVRTLAPIFAGIGHMPYNTFITYNIIGAALWSFGLTSVGYLLGNIVPDIDRYIIPIVILIIVVSLIPTAREYYKSKKHSVPEIQ